MNTRPVHIKNNLYWIGAMDADLRVFDVIMRTDYGTSYNSYLLKGSKKNAIFETVKDKFFEEYLAKIQSLLSVEEIDYIIVDHTEPDHAGSVAKLLKMNPNITVVASEAAMRFLKQIVNFDFKNQVVKDRDRIDLGDRTIEFIAAPFLHWPDSMYSYIVEDQVLITCDSFGSHYASEQIFNDLIEKDPLNRQDLLSAYRYYFDMIMGPFKKYVLRSLEKIENLPLDIVCPGHGPILRENIGYYMDLYRTWSTEEPLGDQALRVTIAYVSAYGYTHQLAQKIGEGIKSTGNFEVYLYDLIHGKMEDVLRRIHWSDGVLFGSPTINGDALKPIWELLITLNPLTHGGKFAAAFGSYGWSGEAVGNIEDRLKHLRMKILKPGLKIHFKPSEDQLQEAYAFGVEFGNKILEQKKPKS